MSANYRFTAVFPTGSPIGTVQYLDAGPIIGWYRFITATGPLIGPGHAVVKIEVSPQVRKSPDDAIDEGAFKLLLVTFPGFIPDTFGWDFLSPQWNLVRATITGAGDELTVALIGTGSVAL